MSKNYLKAIGEELLPAIAYGDAAGLPVETRSHNYIAGKYGRVSELLPVHENPFYTGEFGAGTWSDDTQLSMAVARALVRVGTFDMAAIADEHVAEYNNTPQVTKPGGQVVKRGWGGSTTHAVERYMAGAPWQECGEVNGAGNGVIMKLAPLAYWLIAHETDDEVAYRQLDEFTNFTHNSPVARVATRTHYDILKGLARGGQLHRLGEVAFAKSWLHEEAAGEAGHEVSRALHYLSFGGVGTQDVLDCTDGKGFYVPQTLAMAYGAFLANQGEFTSSVYEAVNLGGDTDSTASIVAAMSLFRHRGVQNRPADYGRTLHYDELSELSRRLSVKAAAEDF